MKRSEIRITFLLTINFACGVASKPASAQQVKVLLDDKKALVTSVELQPLSTFNLPSDQPGAVWIALEPMRLTVKKGKGVTTRLVHAGHTGFVRSKEQVALPSDTVSRPQLIIIKPKKPTQALTLLPFVMSEGLEDASDRGATLLVAISDCRFSDTLNSGDESEWIPGRKQIITLNSGEVIWLSPGMHSFKNLGSKSAKLVSIEF